MELWQSLLDILLPERCLSCETVIKGRQEISFCPECLQALKLIQTPLCTQCGAPFFKSAGSSHLCGYCLTAGRYFSKARAVLCYLPPVTAAVRFFKYQGKMHGLKTFTALSRKFLQLQPIEEPDLIIPVPLHVRRLRQRGFNQALVLAKKIFPEYVNKINPYVLERHHWLRPQAGLKGVERRRNVKNAFRVSRLEGIQNKRILLVDDVFTTGATVDECARILIKNKATRVDVFTLARVVDQIF